LILRKSHTSLQNYLVFSIIQVKILFQLGNYWLFMKLQSSATCWSTREYRLKREFKSKRLEGLINKDAIGRANIAVGYDIISGASADNFCNFWARVGARVWFWATIWYLKSELRGHKGIVQGVRNLIENKIAPTEATSHLREGTYTLSKGEVAHCWLYRGVTYWGGCSGSDCTCSKSWDSSISDNLSVRARVGRCVCMDSLGYMTNKIWNLYWIGISIGISTTWLEGLFWSLAIRNLCCSSSAWYYYICLRASIIFIKWRVLWSSVRLGRINSLIFIIFIIWVLRLSKSERRTFWICFWIGFRLRFWFRFWTC